MPLVAVFVKVTMDPGLLEQEPIELVPSPQLIFQALRFEVLTFGDVNSLTWMWKVIDDSGYYSRGMP